MLGSSGAQVRERRYFKEKPTPAEVRSLVAMLPGGAADLISTRSRRYAELGLSDRSLSEEDRIALLAAEPGIWRRPVIVSGDRVVVGFDKESLDRLLS